MKFKQSKLALIVVCSLMVTTVFSGCSGSSSKSDAKSGGKKELIEINVGYLPDLPGASPIVIGDEKGFFKEEGLKVNPVKFLSGPPELQAMASGDLDFGYIGPGATFLAAQGQAKIIAISNTGAGDMVLASKKSGVKEWKDLKGKTVGVPKGTSGEMILNLGLEKAGLSQKDLTVMNMDVAGAVAAFAAGKVDAVAIWVPYTKEIEKQVGKDNIVKLGDNDDFYPQYVFPSSWVVNPKFIEKKPEIVQKFMRAWTKANDYRIKNIDETVKLTVKFTQVPEDSLKEMVPITKFIESDKQATYFKDGTAKKWYEGFETMFVKNGKLKEVVPAEKFIVSDPLIKAVEKSK